MDHLSHFTYGWINPIMGFGFAFAGSLLALMCMTQARRQQRGIGTTGRRLKWIGLASLALGGVGIWMMHFTAMIGFKVTESRIGYDIVITLISLAVSIAAVFFGLAVGGLGRSNTILKVLMAGPLTGLGVVFMHYSGMAAINVSGDIYHEQTYFWASVAIAVVAATAALACGIWLDGWRWQFSAAIIMAIAVCSMHYTGMAGVRVTLIDEGRNAVTGIDPIMLILPILAVATIVIITLLFALMNSTTPAVESKRDKLIAERSRAQEVAQAAPTSPEVTMEGAMARDVAPRSPVVPRQAPPSDDRRPRPYSTMDVNRRPEPLDARTKGDEFPGF